MKKQQEELKEDLFKCLDENLEKIETQFEKIQQKINVLDKSVYLESYNDWFFHGHELYLLPFSDVKNF